MSIQDSIHQAELEAEQDYCPNDEWDEEYVRLVELHTIIGLIIHNRSTPHLPLIKHFENPNGTLITVEEQELLINAAKTCRNSSSAKESMKSLHKFRVFREISAAHKALKNEENFDSLMGLPGQLIQKLA